MTAGETQHFGRLHIEIDFDGRSTMRRVNLDYSRAYDYLQRFELGKNVIEDEPDVNGFVITSLSPARAFRIYESKQEISADFGSLPLKQLRDTAPELALEPVSLEVLRAIRADAAPSAPDSNLATEPRQIVLLRKYSGPEALPELMAATDKAVKRAEQRCKKSNIPAVMNHNVWEAEKCTIDDDLSHHMKVRLQRARMVVADLTTPSPEVMFELGYAMGQNRVVHIGRRHDRNEPLPTYLRNKQRFDWTDIDDYVAKLSDRIFDTLRGSTEGDTLMPFSLDPRNG